MVIVWCDKVSYDAHLWYCTYTIFFVFFSKLYYKFYNGIDRNFYLTKICWHLRLTKLYQADLLFASGIRWRKINVLSLNSSRIQHLLLTGLYLTFFFLSRFCRAIAVLTANFHMNKRVDEGGYQPIRKKLLWQHLFEIWIRCQSNIDKKRKSKQA